MASGLGGCALNTGDWERFAADRIKRPGCRATVLAIGTPAGPGHQSVRDEFLTHSGVTDDGTGIGEVGHMLCRAAREYRRLAFGDERSWLGDIDPNDWDRREQFAADLWRATWQTAYPSRGIPAGPLTCHTTQGGIRVHVKPGCRCPRGGR